MLISESWQHLYATDLLSLYVFLKILSLIWTDQFLLTSAGHLWSLRSKVLFECNQRYCLRTENRWSILCLFVIWYQIICFFNRLLWDILRPHITGIGGQQVNNTLACWRSGVNTTLKLSIYTTRTYANFEYFFQLHLVLFSCIFRVNVFLNFKKNICIIEWKVYVM